MTKQLTHWKKLENPDYIGAYALEPGKDLNVTIDKVERVEITGTGGKKEECTVATLKGDHKPLILNVTNCKMIAKIYGTPYIEEWCGKSITLYVAKIRAFGEDGVECLRIRNKAPELPELTPEHPKWNEAQAALSNGSATLAQIKKRFKISTKNEKLLKWSTPK